MPSLPRGRTFWMIVLGLLALNYIGVALFAPGKEPSVTIPYSPTFLAEVDKGNVEKIKTQGPGVTGEFKKAVKYPADDKDAEDDEELRDGDPVVRAL